jgi:coenzyme F420-0:L-glutamate ligase/coenzyme F420-1:gamma-L-glutamate ligase
LGAAGLEVMRDLRGTKDRIGYELHATVIAVGDEIASAAELVMGKADGIPAVIVRGLEVAGSGSARDLVIPEERDLFR